MSETGPNPDVEGRPVSPGEGRRVLRAEPRVAVVIPVFNEAEGIARNLEEIFSTLASIPRVRFRAVVVDDGSSDDTVAVVRALPHSAVDLEVVCLTRNFGKEAALLAGLQASLDDRMDAVLVMDSDLQHPPQLVPQMLTLWRDGVDVVEACKTHRGAEPVLNNVLARGFYRLFGSLTGMDLRGQSDFKLLDRRVVEVYVNMPERDRFFRGLVFWMGFPSARIPFEVPDRRVGRSRWPRMRLWRYSITAISAFTSAPLHFITLLGGVTFVVSVLIAAKALFDKLTGVALEGFTTVILLLLFIGSALMISVGLLGVYVARIHDEVKRRPAYLVDDHRSVRGAGESGRDGRRDEGRKGDGGEGERDA